MKRPRTRGGRRGLTLTDVIAASSLGVVLVGAACTEVARQLHDLSAARADARALVALRAAGERLSSGALTAPAPGAPAALESPRPGLSLSAARADEALDERLAARGLVAVQLRAEWRDDAGRPTSRQLLVVVPSPAVRR